MDCRTRVIRAPLRRVTRSGNSARRVVAVVTTIAFVVAGLLGMAHESTTRHVRCAEHGELVDAHGYTGDAHAPSVATTERGPGIHELPGAPIADHHEHCTLTCVSRAASVHVKYFALAAVTLATRAVATPPVARVDRPIGVYRTAPKTSPPA
jgi:hypothetical protein